MMKSTFKTTFTTQPEAKEIVVAILDCMDVVDFEEVNVDVDINPDYNCPEGKQIEAFDRGDQVSVFLDDQEQAKILAKKVETELSSCGYAVQATICEIKPESWQNWRKNHRPIHVSERLLITPSWESPAISDGQVVLTIDPQMAFGTGSHMTTLLCLKMIDGLLAVQPYDRFLDIGCGSGILSLAARKLGCHATYGFDIDADAITIARQNAIINNQRDCNFYCHNIASFRREYHYDLVCANIISSVLKPNWDLIWATVKPGGQLIVSGLLVEEQDPFLAAVQCLPNAIVRDQDWLAFRVTKPF